MSKFSSGFWVNGPKIRGNCLFTENLLIRKLGGKVCVLRRAYLSVYIHSCCFYIQYHRGIREISSMPVQIFCFILNFIILTRWRNIRSLYHVTIQKDHLQNIKVPIWACCPLLPSPLFAATPVFIFKLSVHFFVYHFW